MIDIHCHLLPGVDDGARTLEDSLAMAEQAVAEGISHILVTPHHKNGKFENPGPKILQAVSGLQEELDRRHIPLTLFPGQELRINGDILSDMEKDDILFADEAGQYLLIEFPTMSIPHFAESLFFKLQQRGITPIIVHPERNQKVIENPNLLLEFVEKGALTQVTAASYVGIFGKEIEKLSRQLIEANLVHVLASDAHNIKGRAFHMKEAFEKLTEEFGERTTHMFEENAKSIVNGDQLITRAPMEIKKKKKFLFF